MHIVRILHTPHLDKTDLKQHVTSPSQIKTPNFVTLLKTKITPSKTSTNLLDHNCWKWHIFRQLVEYLVRHMCHLIYFPPLHWQEKRQN
mmetsp:Transcript_7018/g.14457  ORF Transcript_7018/g.14457 Transcript_7018/m.14457 type:complete len:89 (-) Transcript_7018:804-1070(-)